MEGWIKLHRKIIKSEIYPKSREFTKFEAWIDLLIIVNHEDGNVILSNEVLECKRGQSIRSIDTYQSRWNWSRQQVRSFFILLKKLSMIEQNTTNKTTIITICNYDTYQSSQPTDNQRITNGKPTDNQRITINKNEKNKENEKKENNKINTNVFIKPRIEEINDYCLERKNNVSGERFYDHYEAKGWMIGKNKMKDWKAAVRTWEKSSQKEQSQIQERVPLREQKIDPRFKVFW